MSLLKTNEIQNYNGSSLTLTASTVSTSAQLNTGGNISVTGSLNVSDDSTTRTNLGLGTIATQDSNNVNLTGGTIGSSVVFPAGKIINVGYGTVADSNDVGQHFSSNSITFGTTSGIPALSSSSNKVFMIWSAQYEKRSGGSGAYFLTYAQGGGLGSETSGQQLTDGIFYIDPNNHRKLFTMPIYDVNPGSTTPTYSLYHNSTPYSDETWSISRNRIMTFEIQG